MGFGADEFISFLPPPGAHISNYNRSLLPNDQPDSIPRLFLDAMAVREAVFVHEQGVQLDRELDADDPRAYHWIAYASVSRRGSNDAASSTTTTTADPPEGRRESESSTAIRVPVGTIRLLPPFDPHADNSHTAQIAPHPSVAVAESYVLLGRLAVAPAYRGLGLGRLLVSAALDWARTHGAEAFTSALSPAELEALKLGRRRGDDEGVVWKGLVVVHSQKGDAENVWARMGFVKDKSMGDWVEEGIDHVGMWRRLEIPPTAPFSIGR
jgi:predicted GNAT family N-acyltransferase